MASYLFFFGVGVYESYSKTLEYPDGSKIDLELLSLPAEQKLDENQRNNRTKQYMAALEALHDSVLWTYHSTGPETCEHVEDRKKVKALIKQREALKQAKQLDQQLDQQKLAAVRKDLKQLMAKWKHTGYKYTGQTYREIGMQNSNYGGMENVGNTTILQSRLAPTDYISDGAYEYMEAVKIHEYYHNINGSQVTGYSPFEIWLNEAVRTPTNEQQTATNNKATHQTPLQTLKKCTTCCT
jgi:aminopeptidase N